MWFNGFCIHYYDHVIGKENSMRRSFNLCNNYNIVGFCSEFQEFIRIVRYVPEKRLVCIIRLIGGGYWNHPDDINDKSRYVLLPSDSDRRFVFEEVSYEEVAAAGWDKYLRVFRSDYDFNETSMHAAHEDDEKLTLTMWGGYIDGRRLYTNSIPRTNRFFLHVYKPFTIYECPFNVEDLSECFVEWFDIFASGGAEPVLFTEWYSDGTDSLRFCLRNPAGECTQVEFKSRRIEVEIDRTDWRLQCIGREELANLRKMPWRYKIYEPYSETWTHEHCILCNGTIDEGDAVCMNEETQTADTKFLCIKCMDDFSDIFGENR